MITPRKRSAQNAPRFRGDPEPVDTAKERSAQNAPRFRGDPEPVITNSVIAPAASAR
jgi:hypothetical protein